MIQHGLPPVAALRSSFRDQLSRIRWLLLLAALGNLLLYVPYLALGAAAPGPQRAAAAAGLLWLGGWWGAGHWRARFPWPGDLLEGLALLVIGAAAGPEPVLGLWYAGLLLRSLYEPRRRVAVLTVIYLAALLGAGLLASPLGDLTPDFGIPLAGFAVTAGPLALLVAALAQHEQAAGHQRILAATGAALVAAPDRDAICAALAQAGLSLLPGRSDVRVSVWIGDQERMVAAAAAGDRAGALLGAELDARSYLRRYPLTPGQLVFTVQDAAAEQFSGTLNADLKQGAIMFVPLAWAGELRGALAVGSDGPLPASLTEALAGLGAQAALALERATLTDNLRHSEARFRSLVQNSSDIVIIIGADAVIEYVSPAVQHILGHAPAALLGTNLHAWLRPEETDRVQPALAEAMEQPGSAATVEWEFRDAAGGWRTCETTVASRLDDPSVQGIVLTARDIGERKAQRDDLAYQASHDSLTGLANRTLFRKRVEQALARQRRRRQPLAVLFLDLDNFKRINDTLGHAAGDQALVALADRIRRRLRATDTAARFGGDEFALLLEDLRSPADAARLAGWLLGALRIPQHLEGREVTIEASIGIAVSMTGEESADDLLRNADIAMYSAKGQGKGRYELFEPAMHAAALQRLEAESDLRLAVERREFELRYQPIVALGSGRIVGMEALIRWRHPERGLLAPSEFVPLAEETGLIQPVTRWVLQRACRRARRWQARYPGEPPLTIAVNLSARLLRTPGLVTEVAQALREARLEPHRLLLEISESALEASAETLLPAALDLKALGVRLALDDFGSGAASLRSLRRFPFDVVKIEAPFVGDLDRNPAQAELTQALLEMIHALGLQTLAERVERREQAERLRALGCELAQGDHFSRPLTNEEVAALLRQGASEARSGQQLA